MATVCINGLSPEYQDVTSSATERSPSSRLPVGRPLDGEIPHQGQDSAILNALSPSEQTEKKREVTAKELLKELESLQKSVPKNDPEAAMALAARLQQNERNIKEALKSGRFQEEDLTALQRLNPILYHQHQAAQAAERARNRPDPRSPEQIERQNQKDLRSLLDKIYLGEATGISDTQERTWKKALAEVMDRVDPVGAKTQDRIFDYTLRPLSDIVQEVTPFSKVSYEHSPQQAAKSLLKFTERLLEQGLDTTPSTLIGPDGRQITDRQSVRDYHHRRTLLSLANEIEAMGTFYKDTPPPLIRAQVLDLSLSEAVRNTRLMAREVANS